VSATDGLNKEVWMTIAQGGRWTVGEVKEALCNKSQKVDRALYALRRNGLIEQYGTEPVKYGISNDCITPRKTTVGEVLAVMGYGK
jgi:transcription initiation factor IIE alpha subunit